MRPFILFLALIASARAEITATYLSWYSDPATTMTIQWLSTPDELKSHVQYRAIHESEWTTALSSHKTHQEIQIHRAHLTHLHPDTEYEFQLSPETSIRRFKTAPSRLNRPLRFIIGGDAYRSEKLFAKMNQTISQTNPLFVAIGGDIAYAIKANVFQSEELALKRWIAFLKLWTIQGVSEEGKMIPFLLAAGNHDVSPVQSDLFFDLFAFPEKKLFRALDFGDYLSLIFLDTGHLDPIEGNQTLWLEKTLAKRTQIPNRFAIYHEAAYPSFYPFSGPTPTKIRAHWCPLFDQYNLSAAFENHNHTYKRTFPISDNTIVPPGAGVVYLGDGCWGVSPRKTTPQRYLEKRESKNSIFLVELSTKGALIEALDNTGESFDRLLILNK